MAEATPTPYSADPTLYLYTSLTAGSSHIITATSRLETILKAHRIPFRAIDVATDEKARMLWGRRSKGKKLPGIVQYGEVLGDLEEIEEWNEYGELKERLGVTPLPPIVPNTVAPSKATPPAKDMPAVAEKDPSPPDLGVSSTKSKESVQQLDSPEATPPPKDQTPLTLALRQAGLEAAKKASERKASQTSKNKSIKSEEPTEISGPIIVTESTSTKLAEDSSTDLETTEARVPQKLADEGVQTAIGVVGDDSDPADGKADDKADTLTENQPKKKSPLSEEVATAAVDEPEKSGPSPAKTSIHRGSSVSMASKEEIREVEKSNAIAEEPEAVDVSIEASGAPVSKAAVENEAIEQSTTVDVTVSTAEEAPSGKVEDPQKQDPKDPEAAGKSVGD